MSSGVRGVDEVCYSRTPHNPYQSVDRPGYGLSEGMGLRGCAKNRAQKIRKKSEKIILLIKQHFQWYCIVDEQYKLCPLEKVS